MPCMQGNLPFIPILYPYVWEDQRKLLNDKFITHLTHAEGKIYHPVGMFVAETWRLSLVTKNSACFSLQRNRFNLVCRKVSVILLFYKVAVMVTLVNYSLSRKLFRTQGHLLIENQPNYSLLSGI